MAADAGRVMKERLRAELLVAMRHRHADEARLIRSLVAAIDNAQAPPLPQAASPDLHDFRERSAEVERLALSETEVRQVLQKEYDEREQAAASLDALGKTSEAAALRNEMSLIARHIGQIPDADAINKDDGLL